MSSNSSASPDESKHPSQNIPVSEGLSMDEAEAQLWTLEDDLSVEKQPVMDSVLEGARSRAMDFPLPREKKTIAPPITEESKDFPPRSFKRGIQIDVRKPAEKDVFMEDLDLPVKSQDDIEDFEQWEPISHEAEPVNLLESISNGQQVEVFTPTHSLEEVKSLDSPVSDLDSFSSDPKKVAFPLLLLSRLGLSKIEQGGVLAFFVLLLLCGLFAYAFSINRIPTDSGDAKPLHFPIKGAHVILDNAVTYWRAPIIDGPSPDVFRRGMVLLPIVELKVLSGHGAIRVSFIDENQESIGDMVTREVSEKGVLKVVGTAGYEELGMFTAYRTGDKKPWTIKVLEGPSVDAKSNEFKELFEMNLSSETR